MLQVRPPSSVRQTLIPRDRGAPKSSERVVTQPWSGSTNRTDETSSLGRPSTQDHVTPPSWVAIMPARLSPESPPTPRSRPIQPCRASTNNGSPKKPLHPVAAHQPDIAVSWTVVSSPFSTRKRPYSPQTLPVQ